MRKLSLVLACALVALPAVAKRGAVAARGSLPPLTTLSPGAPVEIHQDLDVNVVLIGFQQGSGPQQIDSNRFRSLLPPVSGAYLNGNVITGAPVFGLEPFGLTYALHYNV